VAVKKNLQIWLTVNHKGERLRMYTGKRIDEKNWDGVKQRAKGNSEIITSLNIFLNNLATHIESNINVAEAKKSKVSIQYIKELIDDIKSNNENTFFSGYDQFIEKSRSSRSEGTIKKYKNVKVLVLAFFREAFN
jgi:hypothetical protein